MAADAAHAQRHHSTWQPSTHVCAHTRVAAVGRQTCTCPCALQLLLLWSLDKQVHPHQLAWTIEVLSINVRLLTSPTRGCLSQMFVLMFGGTDTSGQALALTAHYLAHRPQWQQAVREEVRARDWGCWRGTYGTFRTSRRWSEAGAYLSDVLYSVRLPKYLAAPCFENSMRRCPWQAPPPHCRTRIFPGSGHAGQKVTHKFVAFRACRRWAFWRAGRPRA